MKGNKVSELTGKSITELEDLVKNERAGLFQTRRDLVFRKTTDIASVKVRRHNIARILTVLGQKKGEEKKEEAK